MKLKEAFKIMQLNEKDPETVKVFKRTIAFLFYLKTGETLDVHDLQLTKLGIDVLALETDIDFGILHELENGPVITNT